MRCTRTFLSALLTLAVTVPSPAATRKSIETFRAFAASLGTGRAGSLTITINRCLLNVQSEKS